MTIYGFSSPSPFCSKHKSDFVRRNDQNLNMDICCKDAFQFYKRTAGLYKDEFQGTGIIALNAKTYHGFEMEILNPVAKV